MQQLGLCLSSIGASLTFFLLQEAQAEIDRPLQLRDDRCQFCSKVEQWTVKDRREKNKSISENNFNVLSTFLKMIQRDRMRPRSSCRLLC